MSDDPRRVDLDGLAVESTYQCVTAECRARLTVAYLPFSSPKCAACGGRTVLVRVMRAEAKGPKPTEAAEREPDWRRGY